MNILQINCVYGGGSTGGITRDLHGSFWPGATGRLCSMAVARKAGNRL